MLLKKLVRDVRADFSAPMPEELSELAAQKHPSRDQGHFQFRLKHPDHAPDNAAHELARFQTADFAHIGEYLIHEPSARFLPNVVGRRIQNLFGVALDDDLSELAVGHELLVMFVESIQHLGGVGPIKRTSSSTNNCPPDDAGAVIARTEQRQPLSTQGYN